MCRASLLLLMIFAAPLFAQNAPVKQATHIVPAVPPRRDVSKLPEAAQPIYYSALSAAEWLKRAHKPDGRFVYGFQPSLRVQLDGDNFLSQAGAALALARASRYYHDEAGTARARQALLTLLLETVVDSKEKSIRYSAAPPGTVDRLAAHGLLVSAIHELDRAEECKDLLEQADQLCNYLHQLQAAEGMFSEACAENAGLALQGIIRSQKHRPAAWKLDFVRQGRERYARRWQGEKNCLIAAAHAPAYAEAYVQTREPIFAQTVFVMADAVLGLQYREEFGAASKAWIGGLPRGAGAGKESPVPDITSAAAGEVLVEACRLAKVTGDLPRLQRYEQALLANFHFVMSLQYTGQKAQHFVEPFRPSIVGAFHSSHQDGNLKLDYTQRPLCAMVQYLESVLQ